MREGNHSLVVGLPLAAPAAAAFEARGGRLLPGGRAPARHRMTQRIEGRRLLVTWDLIGPNGEDAGTAHTHCDDTRRDA